MTTPIEPPKLTPRWLSEKIRQLEFKIETYERKILRLTESTAKAQEEFETIFATLRNIADGRTANPVGTAKAVVERWLEEGKIE